MELARSQCGDMATATVLQGVAPTFVRQVTSGTHVTVQQSPRLNSTRLPSTSHARTPSTDDISRISWRQLSPRVQSEARVITSGHQALHNIDDLWERFFLEQRERTDGQQELRSELARQQDALTALTSRFEETVDKLVQAELSHLRKECSDMGTQIVSVKEMQISYSRRNDELAQEVDAWYKNGEQQSNALEQLRELVACELQRENASVAEVQEGLRSLRERTSTAIGEVQKFMLELRSRSELPPSIEPDNEATVAANIDEDDIVDGNDGAARDDDDDDVLKSPSRKSTDDAAQEIEAAFGDASEIQPCADGDSHVVDLDHGGETKQAVSEAEGVAAAFESEALLQTSEARELREAMERMMQESRADGVAQIADLERRITDEWTGLRGWVDAAVVAVVNRISALECTLQTEMSDRLSRMQEVTEGVSLSADHMKKMQTELDKLVVEVRLQAVNNALNAGASKSSKSNKNDNGDSSMPTESACDGVPEGTETNKSSLSGPAPNPVGPPQQPAKARAFVPNGSPSPPPVVHEASSPRASVMFPRAQSITVTAGGHSLSAPVAGQNANPVLLSTPDNRSSVSATAVGHVDPLMRSLPRTAVPFMSGVSNGPHSAATSPIRASFTSGSFQAASPLRGQVMQIRR